MWADTQRQTELIRDNWFSQDTHNFAIKGKGADTNPYQVGMWQKTKKDAKNTIKVEKIKVLCLVFYDNAVVVVVAKAGFL